MLWIPIRPDHAIVAVRLGVGRFFFISEIGQKPKYGAAANLSVRRPESRSTYSCFVVCETSNKHCVELLHVCWIAGRSADDNDDDDDDS